MQKADFDTGENQVETGDALSVCLVRSLAR